MIVFQNKFLFFVDILRINAVSLISGDQGNR